jgi:hypothetical protein
MLLSEGVATLARRYEVDYDIDETPEGDPVVILLDPDEMTYHKFNAALMRESERIGAKIHVGRTAPPSRGNRK